jgi:formamidopyrimidine-DNA glycosylase
MPELPEVETTVRTFRPLVKGRRFVGFSSTWPRQVSPSVPKVDRAIRGRKIVKLERRAKQIVFGLDDGSGLLIHLKMSGRLDWLASSGDRARHVRARFRLSGGNTLLFCDARKFGRIRHVVDPQAALANLGPEPLDPAFDSKALAEILLVRKRQIKPLLLDQSVIAGLGNIYSDESLHRANIHPLSLSNKLGWDEIKRLHRSIRQVLREGIKRCGTSFDWAYPGGRMQHYLRVYQRGGKACQACGRPIEVIRVGQRSTHFCPSCQKICK